MSRSLFFRSMAVVVFFLIALILPFLSPPAPLGPAVPSSAIGERDDAEARDSFEILRLRDPLTGAIPAGIREGEQRFAGTIPTRDEMVARSGLAKGTAASLVTWVARGPNNVGGRTRALAIDVTSSTTYLAGGVSGGMWRSTNSGSAWTKVTSPAQLHSVTCIAQDRRAGKTSTWYYGTGEFRGNSASGGGAAAFYTGDGIFKSTNGGVSWGVLPATSTGNPQSWGNPFDYVFSLVADPVSTSDILYAATPMGIRRSSDGGVSWAWALGAFDGSYSRYTDIVTSQTGVLYAALSGVSVNGGSLATGRGIYRSTNGTAWTDITPANFPSRYYRIVIGMAPSNENFLYFLVDSTNGVDGLDQVNAHQFWKYSYLGGDGSGAGGSWSNRGVNLPNESGLSGNAVFDTQRSYDMLVQVKPDNPDVVLVGGCNLYRTTDGFAAAGNWRRIGGYASASTYSWWTNHHPDLHSGVFVPGSPNQYVSGHDGGISFTTDVTAQPVFWSSLNNGYGTTQYYTVAVEKENSGNTLLVGGMQDNGTWYVPSGGSTWSQLFGGDGAACAIVAGSPNDSYYLSAQNGIIYRFLFDSENPTTLAGWTRVDPTGGASYLFINPFAIEPSDRRIMYVGAGPSLWRNGDLTGIPLGSNNTTSTNWLNLSAAGTGSGQISALGSSTASPAGRLYYGTTAGAIFRLDNAPAATVSTVATNISAGKGLPTGYVSSLAVHPTDGNRVIAVFSNYSILSVFLSTDGGGSWGAISGNLEQNTDGSGTGPSCRTAAIVPAGSSTTYFVGTSTGLYSTQTLSGMSTVWVQEGASTIGNVVVDQIDARPVDGWVAVGTHGGGVYTGNVVATGVGESEALPLATALEQNYPNPFNPSTSIRFRLSKEADVSLNVYDLRGGLVAEIAGGSYAAGEHAITWSPRNIASGTYLCRLKAGGTSLVRKLLYIR